VFIMMLMMPLVVMTMVAFAVVGFAVVALTMVAVAVRGCELSESGIGERDGRYGEKALNKVSTIVWSFHVLAPSRLFATIS